MATSNVHIKFGEVSSLDMWFLRFLDRPTHRHNHYNTLFPY